MPALESDLRRKLENVIIEARNVAEGAARSALKKRAVDVAEPFFHFGPKEKELRNRLRARGRQVGDVRNADKTQSIDQLTQELAYEFWHRMLFARFLAENHLLMHTDGVAVSLEECEELAKDADPPAPNGFVLAARYAGTMLPQIFRTDDVLLEIDFAPEQRLALEKLLASLPQKTFLADDSLGWVYQFWQSEEKKRVNNSGEKIVGRTLPAVTQLFTEHYMVQFLLHNTIGAWWCWQHGIQGPPGGAGVVTGKSPVEMEYLRWRDDGTPAAGRFEGWPKALAEFTMLDPCCGSGHFLVAAFNLLIPLRMRDEGLTAAQACEAVLRDNLFGLELDPRCTQIAAFALALAAWKYPNAGGYRPLPTLNIACSGQGVTGKRDEWLALANGDDRLREGMNRLYDLFQQAPQLGSLIDPKRQRSDLLAAGIADLESLLDQALAKETIRSDVEATALGVAARGIAKATELLLRDFHLVTTNVPYLKRGNQCPALTDFAESYHDLAKPDLATIFLERCLSSCGQTGYVAAVIQQNFIFQDYYREFRKHILHAHTFYFVARLGARAFETITGEVVSVAFVIASPRQPPKDQRISGLDVSIRKTPSQKAQHLISDPPHSALQADQLRNPDSRIALRAFSSSALLAEYATHARGLSSGDDPRFCRNVWELPTVENGWAYLQSSTRQSGLVGGCDSIFLWEGGKGTFYDFVVDRLGVDGVAKWIRGKGAWGKRGIAVSATGELAVSLYSGELFHQNLIVLIPKRPEYLSAIWAFCSSNDYPEMVRTMDQSLKVGNAVLKVPIEYEQWQSAAEEEFPQGIPKTLSSPDVVQWFFDGVIKNASDPLQVAVARLLGYRWPEQPKTPDAIDELADSDGILCLPGVRGQAAAAERLLEVLHAAYGKNWSDSVLHKLLTDAGCKAGTTLDDWLRNQFFDQHCKRFQNRPFIWHIWDGRKDGFSALMNYHKLDHKALENLTYAYLGDWITAQSKSDKAGADSRLGAAQDLQAKLKLILAGEPPYDIFVRWKPLHEQAIGWHPDLNDGVRQNIRPFIMAGVFKKEPKSLLKDKDRGNEPKRDKDDYPWFWSGKEFIGDRVNDIHLPNVEKQAARTRKQGAK